MGSLADNPFRAPGQAREYAPSLAHHALLEPPIRTDRVLDSDDVWPMILLYLKVPKSVLLALAVLTLLLLTILITGAERLGESFPDASWHELQLFVALPLGLLTFIGLWAAITAITIGFVYSQVNKLSKARTDLFAPQTHQFSEAGIKVESAIEQSFVPWERYTSANFSRSHLVLRLANRHGFYPLGRRMFANDSEWDRVTAFIKAEFKSRRGKTTVKERNVGDISADASHANGLIPSREKFGPAARLGKNDVEDQVATVSGAPSWQDHRDMMKLLGMRWYGVLLWCLVIAMLVFSLCASGNFMEVTPIPVALSLASFALAGILTVSLLSARRAVRRQHAEGNGFFVHRSYTLFADSIRCTEIDGTRTYSWEQFDELRATSRVVYLKLANVSTGVFLSRGFFSSESEWTRIVHFLDSRINKNTAKQLLG